MAEKTVVEKLADKKSMIQIGLADQEYQSLLDRQALSSAHRSLRVASATRNARVNSKIADRIATASAMLALSEKDVLLLAQASKVGKPVKVEEQVEEQVEQAITL